MSVTNRVLTIYGDSGSGNCRKVRFVAEQLQMPFRWVETSALSCKTRQPTFLAINPAGQVPTVTLPDGRHLAQSNAIMLFLAEGSRLIPTDPYERANMNKWLFSEQKNHEPWIAVRRKLKKMLGKPEDQIVPNLMANDIRALSIMNEHRATLFRRRSADLGRYRTHLVYPLCRRRRVQLGRVSCCPSLGRHIEADLGLRR